jgi:hypothetical protein
MWDSTMKVLLVRKFICISRDFPQTEGGVARALKKREW